MWDQFNNPELQGRLQLIAGYLANKLHGKCILDLNCGTAPLLDWLPTDPVDWGWYHGNDTNQEFVERCREKGLRYTSFYAIPDDKMIVVPSWATLDLDILLCLGYAAHLNEHESSTLDRSLVKIVKECRPEIVIIEAWAGLPKECNLGGVLAELARLGYAIAYSWFVKPTTETGLYQDRVIYILEWK